MTEPSSMGEPESDLGTSTKTNDFLTQLTQRAKDRVDGKRASGVPSAISRSDDKTWPTSTEEKGTLSSQGTNARIRARLISVGPRPEHRWNIRMNICTPSFSLQHNRDYQEDRGTIFPIPRWTEIRLLREKAGGRGRFHLEEPCA